MINKGIGRAVRYSGLGSLDSIFGFFFGFLEGILYVFYYFQLLILFITIINGQLI